MVKTRDLAGARSGHLPCRGLRDLVPYSKLGGAGALPLLSHRSRAIPWHLLQSRGSWIVILLPPKLLSCFRTAKNETGEDQQSKATEAREERGTAGLPRPLGPCLVHHDQRWNLELPFNKAAGFRWEGSPGRQDEPPLQGELEQGSCSAPSLLPWL